MFKKLFFITALIAMLATAFLPGGAALAMSTRIVRFAAVNKFSTESAQPAVFRLRGTYTCDKVQITSAVSGKVISIYAYDVKITGGGNDCSTAQSFNRTISIGTLVPGNYTVLINPDSQGKPQKKFFFTAPIFSTPTPVGSSGASPAPIKP